MTSSHPTVLVAAEPTLYRTGLVALLHQQWPALPLTLTADAGQLVDLVRAQPFQVLILDGGLPGRDLPALLHHLHQARPGQRLLVLATEGARPMAASPPLLVPRHISPSHLWPPPWPRGSTKRPASTNHYAPRARPPPVLAAAS